LAAARLITIAFAAMAFLTGLTAAWYWYGSSKVAIDPGWRSPANPSGPMEPVEPEAQQMAWTAATLKALNEAAALNKVAASWTAVSVALNAASAILGALAF
jgi:hypothetical protein